MSKQKLTGYPSIDKPWVCYYNNRYDENNIPDMSMYQLALTKNVNNLDKVAIDIRSSQNDFQQGIEITYREFFEKVNKNAVASKKIGITANEIVPIVLPNIPEPRYIIYSNSAIGAISYPINPMLPVNDFAKIIDENNIKHVFMFLPFYEKYEKALNNDKIDNIIIVDGTESYPEPIRKMLSQNNAEILDRLKANKKIITYIDYLNNDDDVQIEPYFEKDHSAIIIGTSGTTGTSKGVVGTDKNINATALSFHDGNIFEGSMMDALIPSIGYGIAMLHYQVIDGKKVYLIPELLTDKFPMALSAIKPDNYLGGPVHYINLFNSQLYKNNEIPKHNNYVSGGAALPKVIESKLNNVMEDYEEIEINKNLVVRLGYSCSEALIGGTYSMLGAYKFGSIGIPMPYVTVSIFEPDTDNELKIGERGEICITGPMIMKEYLNNPDETSKVIKPHRDEKRWVHTKDIGYMDEKGHVFILDRIKNIFMRTGFNIHPAKITEFISSIPFIKESYVIGFEHPKEQGVPVAFVQIDENKRNNRNNEEIKNEIERICRENLEEPSVPYGFVFVDAFPRNLGGKIDQLKLIQESGIDFTKGEAIKINTLTIE